MTVIGEQLFRQGFMSVMIGASSPYAALFVSGGFINTFYDKEWVYGDESHLSSAPSCRSMDVAFLENSKENDQEIES